MNKDELQKRAGIVSEQLSDEEVAERTMSYKVANMIRDLRNSASLANFVRTSTPGLSDEQEKSLAWISERNEALARSLWTYGQAKGWKTDI